MRRTLVAPHPIPGNQQEARVGDEVEQVIEPAMRIIAGPTMQFGLDLPYPSLRPHTAAASRSSVFTGDNLRAFQFLSADLLAPFAMCTPLAGSDYYEASAPPDGHRSATGLPTAGPDARQGGRPRTVPTFTTESIDEGGAHLDPDSIATATPQTFTVASPPDR